MTPTVATQQNFDELVAAAGDDLLVLYFWGPNCPNCDVFAADASALFQSVPSNVRILKINAYEETELATRYGLFGVPAFVLLRSGKRLGMMRQYYGREYWQAVVTEQAAAR